MTRQIEGGLVLVWLLLITEISKVHKMNLEITMANMPCRDSNCVHEQYLYTFDDNNGFFHLRACTLLNGSMFQPVVQHDKAWDIKTACGDISLNSDLCNCHSHLNHECWNI